VYNIAEQQELKAIVESTHEAIVVAPLTPAALLDAS